MDLNCEYNWIAFDCLYLKLWNYHILSLSLSLRLLIDYNGNDNSRGKGNNKNNISKDSGKGVVGFNYSEIEYSPLFN